MTQPKWPTVKLGDIAHIAAGGTPKRSNPSYFGGDIPWVKITDIRHARVFRTEETITEEGLNSSAAKIFPAGTLLFSIFATVGKCSILEIKAATNQAIAGIQISDSNVELPYLYHYLSYLRPQIESRAKGVAQNNINLKTLKQLEIPLPPLEEQRRIAEMLDKAVTNLDNSRKSLKALNTFLPNLFESSFNRGNRTITSIGSYLAQTQYGTGAKAGESGTFPILRMGNITFEGQIDFSDLKFIDLDPSEFVKYTLKTGDILFNRTNSKDLVGKTAVYYGEEGSFAYAGYLVRCRANSNSTPEYISGYLNSPTGKAVLRNAAKSIVGMANINAKELQRLPIPEADPVEQRQWAEFAQEIHNLSDKLKKQVTLHHELYESLSARAFTGEL